MKKYIPAAIFAIGVILRGLLIWQAPLWYDENFTLILARLPFDRMLDATAGDVHPPLWYIIEWITFHAAMWPDWCLRLPALAFSILSMVAMWRVMNEMQTSEIVKLTAFGLMAVMPMQLWYAQEARMYAALEFFVLAAFYNALKHRWVLFTISAVCMLYLQNYGLIYLAAIWLAVMVIDRKEFYKLSAACTVACVAFLPWMVVVKAQMSGIDGRYWIMDSSGAAALGILEHLFFSSTLDNFPSIAAHIIVYVGLIIGAWWMVRNSNPFRWAVVIMAFVPMVIAFLASMAWQPMMLFRPLIGSSPFLYLMVAYPLEGLEVKTLRRVMLYAACFVIPLLVSADIQYFQNVAAMKSSGDTRPILDVLSYIRTNWQDGDVIYHADDGSLVNFMPYSADLTQYKMPDCAEPVLGSLSDATRTALEVQIADLESIRHTRAWVLAPTRSPLHPDCYYEQIKPLTRGGAVIVVDDNDYIQSGLWLVEE